MQVHLSQSLFSICHECTLSLSKHPDGCLCLLCDPRYDSSCRCNDGLLNLAEGSEASAALEKVMQLPVLIVQALAHALDYVRPLHMEAVLRYGASFKPFHDAHQMSLSPNALRYAWASVVPPAQSAYNCCMQLSWAWCLQQCTSVNFQLLLLHEDASKGRRLQLFVWCEHCCI